MSKQKIVLIIAAAALMLLAIYYFTKNSKPALIDGEVIQRRCASKDSGGRCLSYTYIQNGKPISGAKLQEAIGKGAKVIDDDLSSF